jgi:probable lipoprotein NlpC
MMRRTRFSTHANNYLTLFLFLALVVSIPFESSAQRKKKRKKQMATVVSTAKSYIGTPYLYGGMSRNGIDCSALIYNSYKAAGISIPRTAEAQSKDSKQSKRFKDKDLNSVRVGDVVFFKFKAKRSKWWHSGMITYVNGDDIRFVHASSSRGVVESQLTSNYYRSNIKNFRRYIR